MRATETVAVLCELGVDTEDRRVPTHNPQFGTLQTSSTNDLLPAGLKYMFPPRVRSLFRRGSSLMISALLPAAGHSTRMGRPKLSLPLGQRTVIEHVINTLKNARIEQILVVVGPHV